MKKTPPARPALADSTRLLRAFADPVRLRLLNLLARERDEVCVCHLHAALDLPQPTVSRHLAYLREHGLVTGRKDGLWVHYRLARPKAGLHEILLGCLGNCLGDTTVFQDDQARLERTLSCCQPGTPPGSGDDDQPHSTRRIQSPRGS